jgi:methionyl-tRNA synthetase
VLPTLTERTERLLGGAELRWEDAAAPLLGKPLAPFEALLQRVEPAAIERILSDTKTEADSAAAAGAATGASDAARAGAAAATTAATQAPEQSAEIDIDTFLKVDLRVARVVGARHVEGADKLLELTLDVGGETRTVFSGIRSAYEPEQLVDKLVVLVANLKPRKMRFGLSQGMVLAAGGDAGIFLVAPDTGATPGMKVT